MITNKYNIGDKVKFKSPWSSPVEGSITAIELTLTGIEYKIWIFPKKESPKRTYIRYIKESDILEKIDE